MHIINLIAGPGVGKSTTASGLFYKMKIIGHNIEYVAEYAKDMTWEGRHNILEDQLYILAKQNRRLVRLQGKVDFAVTDCPLILGLVYTKPNYYEHFTPLVLEMFQKYDNINYYLERQYNYQPIGRNQTAEEASEVDRSLVDILHQHNIPYTSIKADYMDNIMEDLKSRKLI